MKIKNPFSAFRLPCEWLKHSLFILLCLSLTGCVVRNLALWVQVKQYSGDGVIHNCSIIWWPGYRIEFPKFDARRPYEATYKLNRVPWRGAEPATLYLCFFQQNYEMATQKKKSVTASFRISLSDTTGRIVHSSEVHFSKAVWMSERDQFCVYDDSTMLTFQRNENYLLSVSYKPGDVTPPTDQLCLFIENGCRK